MSEKDPNMEEQDRTQSASSADDAVDSTAAAEQPLTETEALRVEVAQLKDQLLRKIAEFENFRRRTREEKDALLKFGAEAVILDLLPIIDDFQRSLSYGKEHPDFETFYKGVEIIYGKFIRTLENRGLKPMEVVGNPFDVDFHDALMQVPREDVEPGTVIDEVEKGYLLHDKVIRHAKVTVAREADEAGTENDA